MIADGVLELNLGEDVGQVDELTGLQNIDTAYNIVVANIVACIVPGWC